tara:strand:+ start:111 stop:1082 length:972 start_codon:yes stop_codon:yes gene_type:complete
MPSNLITLTHEQYYQGKDNTQLSGDDKQYGNYQFMRVDDIINDILATYGGPGMMLEGIRKRHITYHAYRATQELSFDTFRSVKSMEIEIPPSLVMALPHDFVGYVKVTYKDDFGTEYTLFPAIITSNPTAYNQDSDYFLQFDNTGQSTHPSDSNTWFDYHGNTPNTTPQRSTDLYDDSDNFEFDNGRIFGAEPRHMNQNGSFYIDYLKGRIHFSSNITGKTVTLKYISDGVAYLQSGVETGDPWANELNTTQDFIVHKFAQEALIKHVLYACMQSKSPTDPNMVALLKKERFAETRKAKIRLSNIKIEEITQIMRGKSKWIKH